MPRPARTAGLLVALWLPALTSACATLLGDYQLAEGGDGGAGGELGATAISATSASGPSLSSVATSGTSSSYATSGGAVTSSATSATSVTATSAASGGGGLCADNAKDGDETDVDCGGSCPPCAQGAACGNLDANCQSNNCYFNMCLQVAPTCMDGTQNFGETDVDCGGVACPGCAADKVCKNNDDCASNICNPSTLRCAP